MRPLPRAPIPGHGPQCERRRRSVARCNAVLSSGAAFAVAPETTASTMAWCTKSFRRSFGPGSVQKIVAGDGSGGSPGNDGSSFVPRSLVLPPARHIRSLTRIGRLFFLYVGRGRLRDAALRVDRQRRVRTRHRRPWTHAGRLSRQPPRDTATSPPPCPDSATRCRSPAASASVRGPDEVHAVYAVSSVADPLTGCPRALLAATAVRWSGVRYACVIRMTRWAGRVRRECRCARAWRRSPAGQ